VIIFQSKLSQVVFLMEEQFVNSVSCLAVPHTKYYSGDHLKNN